MRRIRGTSAIQPSGPQSSGVKLAQRQAADNAASPHAPRAGERTGTSRAAAMISWIDGSRSSRRGIEVFRSGAVVIGAAIESVLGQNFDSKPRKGGRLERPA